MISRRAFLAIPAAIASGWSVPAMGAAPVFELSDQWERPTSSGAMFRGNVVILGGDLRNTGGLIGEWSAQLSSLAVFGIADLSGVPFFVPKGSIRKELRQASPRAPVLLDWKGEVYAPRLGFPKSREIVAQVHDKDGKLLLRVEGPATAPRVDEVRKAASP